MSSLLCTEHYYERMEIPKNSQEIFPLDGLYGFQGLNEEIRQIGLLLLSNTSEEYSVNVELEFKELILWNTSITLMDELMNATL